MTAAKVLLSVRGLLVGRASWTFRARMREAIGPPIETCKLNDVDPQAWLAYVLAKLPDHPAKRIDELLPWRWKASKDQINAAAA